MRHQQIFLSGLKDADSRPHQPIGSAIDWSPLSECGDLSGLRRRLSARDIESFACGLRLSSDNFLMLPGRIWTGQDMEV